MGLLYCKCYRQYGSCTGKSGWHGTKYSRSWKHTSQRQSLNRRTEVYTQINLLSATQQEFRHMSKKWELKMMGLCGMVMQACLDTAEKSRQP